MIGSKSSRKHYSREELFKAKPIRNNFAEWKEKNGEVSINVNLKKGRFFKLWRFFFSLPEKKNIKLDIIGSEIWKMCDGKNTVKDIEKFVKESYNLSRKEAEISILEYINSLVRRNLIGLEIRRKE